MSSSDFGPAWAPTRVISAVSDNATIIKATPGRLGTITAHNINAAIRYLKLYNKATAPSSADTPLLTIPLPVSGGPVAHNFGPRGIAFSAGISLRIVTGAADNDNTSPAAAEQFVTIGYL